MAANGGMNSRDGGVRWRPGDEGWTVRRPGADDAPIEQNRLNWGYGRVRTTGTHEETERENVIFNTDTSGT